MKTSSSKNNALQRIDDMTDLSARLDAMSHRSGELIDVAVDIARRLMVVQKSESENLSWEDGHLWIGLT